MTVDRQRKRAVVVDDTFDLSSIDPKPQKIPSYGIDTITPLQPLHKFTEWNTRGSVPFLSISPNGLYLASCSTGGFITIYDIESNNPVATLTDTDTTHIEEYLCCAWYDSTSLFVGGKRKDRSRWNDIDDDNHLIPSEIVLFHLDGRVLLRISGHEEEILSLLVVECKGIDYVISTSQDGYIRKHAIKKTNGYSAESVVISDPGMCMTFTAQPLPQTGNRHLIIASDDGLCIVDIQQDRIIQTFRGINTCYCDFVLPVVCVETMAVEEEVGCFLLSRGVEILDAEMNTINTTPNSVKLYRLVYPTETNNEFELKLVW
jgi:WD40 repeat protein